MAASLDRIQAPAFKPFKNFSIKEAETVTLNNGIALHMLKSGSQPVAQIELIFKAGVRHESHYGQAFFAGKLLKEGTSSMSSKKIAAYFDQYGAFLEIQPGLDQLTVSLYSLTKYISDLIPFLKTIVYEAAFPQHELDIQKNIKIQNIKVESDKNNLRASKALRESLFGESHVYGRSLNEDQINKLNREQLLQFHQKNVTSNLEIFVSGDFNDEHIKLIDVHFGELTIDAHQEDKKLAAYETKAIQKIIEKEDSLQSSIRMGKHLIQKNHKDYAKLSVTIEILGGYFGSRLMKNIREEKGYTYGIHATMVNLHKASYFVIGTDVKKSFTAATVDEIYKEITLLQNEEVPQNELDTVKNYLLGTFQSSITSPFSLMEKFKSIHFHQLGYDHFQHYIQSIQAIDKEDILLLSNQYLQIDSLSEIIVGGK